MSAAERVRRARRLAGSAPVALVALVAANLVPLLGVLLLGWDVATILFLYWLENGIVGALNVPRILLAAQDPSSPFPGTARLGTAIFFAIHYGVFWVVHGVFITVLTGDNAVFSLFAPFGVALGQPAVLIGAVGLLASHLVSLLVNYIGRREYLNTTPDSQMWRPYPRMVVLHVTIILGGALVLEQGEPILFVAVLVVLKTVIDLALHLAEHRRAAVPAA